MISESLVAVVEDDAGLLSAFGRALRAAGFAIAPFRSAEEFLASPPVGACCLVLDHHLGGMSGLDLQRHLRSRGSLLPIILMTAFDDAGARDEAERLGCAGYLQKATDLDVVVRLIRSVLGFADR
jgi:FixJ family two-component response regulator